MSVRRTLLAAMVAAAMALTPAVALAADGTSSAGGKGEQQVTSPAKESETEKKSPTEAEKKPQTGTDQSPSGEEKKPETESEKKTPASGGSTDGTQHSPTQGSGGGQNAKVAKTVAPRVVTRAKVAAKVQPTASVAAPTTHVTTTSTKTTSSTSSSTVPDDGISDGTYVIKSALADTKVLDVAAGSKASGTNVQLYESNMTAAQRWTIKHEVKGGKRTGYVTITSGTKSNEVLDVSCGRAASGANVQQYASNGTKAQRWRLVKSKSGSLYTICSALGNGLVLDISGAGTDNGTNVQIYRSNGTRAQLFQFLGGPALEGTLKAEAPTDSTDYSGTYVIRSAKDTSYVLDVSAARDTNGTNVQLYKDNGTFAQKFALSKESYKGKSAYRVRCLATDTVLDVSGGNLVPTTNLQAWSSAKSCANQLFYVRPNSDARHSVTLFSAANGLALDVAGARMANGTNVQTYTSNGTVAQRFVLSKPSQLLSNGLYELQTCVDGSKRIDVVNGSTADHARVQVYSSNGTTAQKWLVKHVGSGNYTLESVRSGKYLSVDGGQVHLEGTSTKASRWTLSVRHGAITLTSSTDGRVLDVSGAGTANGTSIGLYRSNGTKAQRFVPLSTVPLADGYYRIGVDGSSLAMDVSGGSLNAGAAVQAYQANGTEAQEWHLQHVSGDVYLLKSARSGEALDVCAGGTGNGTAVQQWDDNGTTAQRWHVTYVGGGRFQLVSSLSSGLKLSAQPSLSSGTRLYVTRTAQKAGQTYAFSYLGSSPRLTWKQQRVINAAYSTPSPGPGLCAGWVTSVVRNAGFGTHDGNANNMYWNYCHSSNLSALKPGMIVAVSTHSHTRMGRIYGHVAIYIGNGKVRDNIGWIRESSFSWWTSYYGTTVAPKWGWLGNVDLTR